MECFINPEYLFHISVWGRAYRKHWESRCFYISRWRWCNYCPSHSKRANRIDRIDRIDLRCQFCWVAKRAGPPTGVKGDAECAAPAHVRAQMQRNSLQNHFTSWCRNCALHAQTNKQTGTWGYKRTISVAWTMLSDKVHNTDMRGCLFVLHLDFFFCFPVKYIKGYHISWLANIEGCLFAAFCCLLTCFQEGGEGQRFQRPVNKKQENNQHRRRVMSLSTPDVTATL